MKSTKLTLARIICLALAIVALFAPARAQSERRVDWIEANGELSRVMLGYIKRAIAEAESDGAAALVIQLQPPGGELGAMQRWFRVIRASAVPVIVYVAPRAVWAESAGDTHHSPGHVAPWLRDGHRRGQPIGSGQQNPRNCPGTAKRKLIEATQALARSLSTRRSAKAIQLAQDTIENAKAAAA
jgi:membrane-bound serine protease (ClpP class)